jgi:hypothetical protein
VLVGAVEVSTFPASSTPTQSWPPGHETPVSEGPPASIGIPGHAAAPAAGLLDPKTLFGSIATHSRGDEHETPASWSVAIFT